MQSAGAPTPGATRADTGAGGAQRNIASKPASNAAKCAAGDPAQTGIGGEFERAIRLAPGDKW